MLISIRRQMYEAERLSGRFRALVNAFLGVAAALPKTAAPANPEQSRQCKEELERLTEPLKGDPAAESIDALG